MRGTLEPTELGATQQEESRWGLKQLQLWIKGYVFQTYANNLSIKGGKSLKISSCTSFTSLNSLISRAALTPLFMLKLMSTLTSVKESVSLMMGTWEHTWYMCWYWARDSSAGHNGALLVLCCEVLVNKPAPITAIQFYCKPKHITHMQLYTNAHSPLLNSSSKDLVVTLLLKMPKLK